jgi:hypothetical protein
MRSGFWSAATAAAVLFAASGARATTCSGLTGLYPSEGTSLPADGYIWSLCRGPDGCALPELRALASQGVSLIEVDRRQVRTPRDGASLERVRYAPREGLEIGSSLQLSKPPFEIDF